MESIPTSGKKSAQEAWQERAQDWRAEGQPHSFFTGFVEAHRAEMGSEMLDIGCGNGIYLLPLAANGFHVTGVDISTNMLAAAKAKLEAAGVAADTVELKAGTTDALPCPDQSFDSAISFGVFHFNDWDGIQKSFSEASRVLKPGSYFLLQVRSVNDADRDRVRVADTPGGFIATDVSGGMKDVEQHYFTK